MDGFNDSTQLSTYDKDIERQKRMFECFTIYRIVFTVCGQIVQYTTYVINILSGQK